MDPSLVGSQMSSDALSEESLVREGAGYDETFGSGDESEDFSPSSERETSSLLTPLIQFLLPSLYLPSIVRLFFKESL